MDRQWDGLSQLRVGYGKDYEIEWYGNQIELNKFYRARGRKFLQDFFIRRNLARQSLGDMAVIVVHGTAY